MEEKPAASKLILWDPENRTELLYVSEEGRGKVQDHMLFLLAVKQDDLIKSSAKFYMSGTKLLLLRERFKVRLVAISFWHRIHYISSEPRVFPQSNLLF